MIPVIPQPEPPSFDRSVRKPGMRWLRAKKIAPKRTLPPRTKLPPHWRECLGDLHAAYGGICAYLCIHVERCTGGTSADHYVAKSRQAGLAYEWSNYRLASTTMNARKRDYDTVIDPFAVTPGAFRLELVTGRIYANQALPKDEIERVKRTIRRLGLDDALCREMRARRFGDYLAIRGAKRNPQLEAWLKAYSPLIWLEAERQGVL